MEIMYCVVITASRLCYVYKVKEWAHCALQQSSKQFLNAEPSTTSRFKWLGIQSLSSKILIVNKVALFIHLGVRMKSPNKRYVKSIKTRQVSRERLTKQHGESDLRTQRAGVASLQRWNYLPRERKKTHGKKLSLLFKSKKLSILMTIAGLGYCPQENHPSVRERGLTNMLETFGRQHLRKFSFNAKLPFNLLYKNKRPLSDGWRTFQYSQNRCHRNKMTL